MATLTALRDSTLDGKLPAYVWPGGYPMEYITRDGLVICPACANGDGPDATFLDESLDPVVQGEVYWEGEPFPCDDCGKLIDSAYGEMGA